MGGVACGGMRTLDGGRAVEHRSCARMTTNVESTAAVAAHYGKDGLLETILGALRAAGKDLERLAVDDLVPIDQFHLRGRDATVELLQLAGLGPGERVLDV